MKVASNSIDSVAHFHLGRSDEWRTFKFVYPDLQ